MRASGALPARGEPALPRSNRGSPTLRALLACIEPWSLEQFLADIWQQSPLLIPRKDPVHFVDLVSLDEFDLIVSSTGLRHPYFRVFKEGHSLPLDQTTTARQLGSDVDRGLADLNTLYDQHAEGATIVLQALERWWPSFHSLCREFELAFGFPTQAHAYLTPESAQGTPIHYDTHDVFVLQVEGAKRWRVWEPLRALPMRLSEDRYDAEAVAAHAAQRQPFLDVELAAGDSLYLPRGFIHEVRTERARSLHVTISVMMDRWVDLAESAIVARLAALRDIEAFRESLPFGRTPFSEPDSAMRESFERLAQTFLEGVDLEVGFELMRRKMVTYATPSFRGRFLDIERVRKLTPEHDVFVRSDAIVSLTEDRDSVTLHFGAAREEFADSLLPALRHIVANGHFRPCELPGGLDQSEQLALTRRLVESGLCTLAAER